jgi:hypothetical protein
MAFTIPPALLFCAAGEKSPETITRSPRRKRRIEGRNVYILYEHLNSKGAAWWALECAAFSSAIYLFST